MSDQYIVERDCRILRNGVTVPFRKGQMVSDESTVAHLRLQRAPMTLVVDSDDVMVCPHCSMSFSLSEQMELRRRLAEAEAGAAELRKRAAALGLAV